MEMFSAAALVTGGDFKQINGDFIQFNENRQDVGTDDSATFRLLMQEATPNALHNSGERQDAATCHPNTRIAIRERITEWIQSQNKRLLKRLIMWLHGPAGAGKTALAQTIAELFDEEGILLAAFFFSRFDSSRNRSRSLISTIAYQAALSFPTVRADIIAAIDHDPHLFNKSRSTQMTLLLLEPLRPLISSGYFNDPKCRRVIIIDGLDECVNRKEQLEILATIADVLQNHHFPLSFIIASRPEHEIKSAFGTGHLKDLSIHLPLDDDLQSNNDIELFLRDRLDAIKLSHPFKEQIQSTWPADEVITCLVRKSSGQFIYASTVIKFVESSRKLPTLQLDIILGLRSGDNAQPFEELDELYKHIFSSIDNPNLSLRILALFVLRQGSIWSQFPWHWDRGPGYDFYPDPANLSTYEDLLGLASGDADVALCDLGSLLEIQTDENRKLQFFHASLDDFLLDKSRSGIFHIDRPTRNAEIAHYYFQCFQKAFRGNDLLWFAVYLKDASPTPTLLTDVVNVSFDQFWRSCQQELSRERYLIISCTLLTSIKKSKLPKWVYALNYFRFICTAKIFPVPEIKRFALAEYTGPGIPLGRTMNDGEGYTRSSSELESSEGRRWKLFRHKRDRRGT